MSNKNHNIKTGQFERKGYKGKRATVHPFYILLLIVVAVAGFIYWNAQATQYIDDSLADTDDTLEYISDGESIAGKILEQKITMLEDEVLETLAHCETGGVAEPNSALIFDSNNEASIGSYQYQRDTVIYYVEMRDGETINRTESIALAIDFDRATELTRYVLFETENGWKNWWNCSKKHDLHTQIALINKLR